MKTIQFNVQNFEADPDASLVLSLMIALNDIERQADLRNVHFTHPRKHQPESFEASIGSYTANLVLAHVSEAFLIIRKIRDQKSRPIYTTIQSNGDLKTAFEKACKYIDDTKDAITGESPYDALLRKWKNLRNYVVFHYNGDEDKIPPALALVAKEYKTSSSFYGEKNEPTFHELAYEVLDAVASDALGYPFPNDKLSVVENIVRTTEPMLNDFRSFAHQLVRHYVDLYAI